MFRRMMETMKLLLNGLARLVARLVTSDPRNDYEKLAFEALHGAKKVYVKGQRL